jgi:hypothetical protein
MPNGSFVGRSIGSVGMPIAGSNYFRRLCAVFNGLRKSRVEKSPPGPIKIQFQIEGFNGSGNAQRLQDAMAAVPGIGCFSVDPVTGWVDVECERTKVLEIAMRVGTAGFPVGRMQLFASAAPQSA